MAEVKPPRPAPTQPGPLPAAQPELGPPHLRYAPEAILRRMGTMPEAAMRVAAWHELFRQRPPEAVVAAVQWVRGALMRRETAGRLAWIALVQSLETIRGGPVGLALYWAAQRAEAHALQELLLATPPLHRAPKGSLRPPPILLKDRELTLGERRSWARRPHRESLQRILLDPDPGVIRHVLNNPVLVQADVLSIASRRPNSPEVLREIFEHPRWGRHAAVQHALILNPYLATDLACGLVALLPADQLRALSVEPTVHPAVRVTAQSMREATQEARGEPAAAPAPRSGANGPDGPGGPGEPDDSAAQIREAASRALQAHLREAHFTLEEAEALLAAADLTEPPDTAAAPPAGPSLTLAADLHAALLAAEEGEATEEDPEDRP